MVEEAANVLSDWRLKRAAQEKAAESKQSDENVEIRRQQRLLEYERQEFLRNKKFEEKRLEREKHIFDMEWKMLDLIKIFHPDNAEGDTDVIQKINEEYEVLRKRIGMEK